MLSTKTKGFIFNHYNGMRLFIDKSMKGLKIIRRSTYKTTAKRRKQKQKEQGQTMIYKTLLRKLMIEHQEPR